MTKQEWKKFRGSAEKPDHIMLSLNGPAESSRTVSWRTSRNVENGYILYRKKGSQSEWMKSDAKKNAFDTDMDSSNYFFADMKDLEADTQYEYICGNEVFSSDVFTFRTSRENIDKFTFLALSDIQTGGPEPPPDYTFLGQFIKGVLKEHPEIEFILTAGDNTNCGQTDLQWCGLFEGLKGIIETVPFMMSMGNHDDFGYEDYYTGKGKYYSEFTEYFSNMLKYSYPQNGPEGRKTANYSFDYGDAHFAVASVTGYEIMNEWLKKDAKNSDKKWKFSVHHFPVCYSTVCLEIEDTYPALKDGLESFDIVFSGHEHCFARSFPRLNNVLYDRPSQGTVHYNLGSGNRNPSSRGIVSKAWNCVTYGHEQELSMFALVTVDGGKCTLTSYLEDGRIVDSCVIDKENDVILPYSCAPVHRKTRLKFKGYDIGIINENTLPKNIDGVWYISPGQLVSFIGGEVLRTQGRIHLEIYGKKADFTENSDVAETGDGNFKMQGKCLRLDNGQLFVPVDDFCKAFNMHPMYFPENNFISIECEEEKTYCPVQP